MTAKLVALVDAHLRGCLPPGVPPSYRSILSADYDGAGKARKIAAHLIMFDGLPAIVTLTKGWAGLSHRFHMTGAVYYERGRWHREVEPHPDLFGSALRSVPASRGMGV